MTSRTDTEIGSIVAGLIAGIPVGISGILTTIVDQQVYFAEQYINETIGITAIEDKYQPAIISLTSANVLELMEAQGLGTKSVKIGELSISKGMVEGTSKGLRNSAMEQLDVFGTKINSYQSWN